MIITEVQINFVKPKNGLVGFASIVIDDSFYLSSIAIHQKLNSLNYRLTYPNKDKFTIFHPINKETSLQVEKAVFEKLKNVMKKVNGYEERAF